MARVSIYENQVERQGITGERHQAGDFGPSGIAQGLETLGKAGARFAAQMDDVEDVKARIEANNLLVEHSEASRQIGNGVKQTLGEGAEAAAEGGIQELDKRTKDILGRASPRARMILDTELRQRNIVSSDSFLDHGFREQAKAVETSSVAAINAIVEEAADEPDEEKAKLRLSAIAEQNAVRAKFFGHGSDWEREQNRQHISGFFRSRALKLAVGVNGSASDAVEYATANRQYLTDDHYLAIVNAYQDNALDERALVELEGGQPASATTANVASDSGEPARALDFDGVWKAWYIPQEGTKYAIDNDGHPVKYGINGRAHPNENIKGMTEGRAKQIIKAQYWDELGVDRMPPAIAAMAFDTAVISGPGRAKQLLKESGGDPDKFMRLRKSFLAGLSKRDPKTYPPGTWDRRNKELEAFADRQGGGVVGAPVVITASSSLEDFRSSTMARTDIGTAYKLKLIDAFDRRRRAIRQEREIQESEAQRALTQAVIGLGDGFTDLKQLPQDALLNASPSTIASFTEMAKGNRENKPLDPELAAEIKFVEISDPKRFASEEFRNYLIEKGAPTSTIRAVSERQGAVAAHLANPGKIDPIADGTLWSIAKEPFEAAGLFLDTTEKKGNVEERKADAQRKGQAVTFLRGMMQSWMVANPGKKPDDATIKGWVGWALLKHKDAAGDKRAFEMSDQQYYMSLPDGTRSQIIQSLYRGGPKPPRDQIIRDVTAVHRDFVARQGGIGGQ